MARRRRLPSPLFVFFSDPSLSFGSMSLLFLVLFSCSFASGSTVSFGGHHLSSPAMRSIQGPCLFDTIHLPLLTVLFFYLRHSTTFLPTTALSSMLALVHSLHPSDRALSLVDLEMGSLNFLRTEFIIHSLVSPDPAALSPPPRFLLICVTCAVSLSLHDLTKPASPPQPPRSTTGTTIWFPLQNKTAPPPLFHSLPVALSTCTPQQPDPYSTTTPCSLLHSSSSRPLVADLAPYTLLSIPARIQRGLLSADSLAATSAKPTHHTISPINLSPTTNFTFNPRHHIPPPPQSLHNIWAWVTPSCANLGFEAQSGSPIPSSTIHGHRPVLTGSPRPCEALRLSHRSVTRGRCLCLGFGWCFWHRRFRSCSAGGSARPPISHPRLTTTAMFQVIRFSYRHQLHTHFSVHQLVFHASFIVGVSTKMQLLLSVTVLQNFGNKFGYLRPVYSDPGVRGSLQGQQSSSVLVLIRLFMGIRGSQRWQQSSSDNALSDVYTPGYLRLASSGSGVRGSLQWPQSSSVLARHHLGVRGSRCWQQSSSDNPTFSGKENVFKRSSRLESASRAISLVRSPLMAKELKVVYISILLEALLKKLPVFISDAYRLTYPFIALFLVYAASVLISLAKSPPLVISI